MKFILAIVAVCLTSSLFGQTPAQLQNFDSAINYNNNNSHKPVPSIPNYTRSIIGLNDQLVIYTDTSGNLRFVDPAHPTQYYLTLHVPSLSANATINFPATASTLAANPTGLTWGFPGATYTTTLSVTDPTVGAETITIPDYKGVATNMAAVKSATLTAGATPAFAPGAAITEYLLTPGEAETIAGTVTGCVTGQRISLIILTSGTTSRTITFGSNFDSRGTLETGVTTAIRYTVVFEFDGTHFVEISRSRGGATVATLPYVVTTSVFTHAEGVEMWNFTPVTAVTLNSAVVPRAGYVVRIAFIGDSTGRTTTFGTGFSPASSTIATGADTKSLIWTGISNGTSIFEVSRTVGE